MLTRSKSRANTIVASGNTARRGTRTLTTSFKVSKDAVATKSKAAKITVPAASVRKTTRTTITSQITTTTVVQSNDGCILGEEGAAATDNVPNPSVTWVFPPTSAADAASPHDLLAQGLHHLRIVSPALAQWIDNEDYSHILTGHLRKPDDPPPNYFRSLARGIISQQVSGAAAASILRKFIALFYNPTPAAPEPPEDFFPAPQEVLNRTHDELRTAGLSERKAQYMHSLATEFIEDKSLTELHTLSDENVIEKLTKVKGIGVWSAEMFLIFTLGRWDIFSIGDLGIQRGMAVWDGRDVNKLKKAGGREGVKKVAGKWKYMSEEDMMRLSEGFKPWRTLFCLVMWKASDTQVASMKEKGEGEVKKSGTKRKGKKKVVEEGEEDEE